MDKAAGGQRTALRQRSTRRQRSPINRQIDGPEKSTEVAHRAGSGQRVMAHAHADAPCALATSQIASVAFLLKGQVTYV